MPQDLWRRLLRRSPEDADVPLYGPLLPQRPTSGEVFVLGRVAQSLDGFIALRSGESHWISGPEDIAHTHRLRALFDAVVVGAGTVAADNPQLTTRLVEGPSPVRVVLDPQLRLAGDRRVFQDGPATLVACSPTAPPRSDIGRAELLRLPAHGDGLDLRALLAALADRGLRRIFVEGGGITVTRFLRARLLDRLHVTVAPLLIGRGVPAFPLPPLATLRDGMRFDWTMHRLGADVLLDIPLDRRT